MSIAAVRRGNEARMIAGLGAEEKTAQRHGPLAPPVRPRALFVACAFTNAVLLFLVQPLFGRMALPHVGGNSAVWTTCLLFFETALLAGYLYAHLLASQFRPRTQLAIHAGLLAFASLTLPITVPPAWSPASPEEPVPSLLALLAIRVGPAFVLLAAGSPLLQHWLSRIEDPGGRDPYTLAVASNLGSVVGLLAYPLLLEPTLGLSAQSRWWSVAYGLLVVLWVLCGRSAAARTSGESSGATSPTPPPAWRDRLQWLLLAAVPSSLLLGVTTHVTTDLAPIPLLWVVPLALYLLTFVVAFSSRQHVSPVASFVLPYLVIGLVVMLFLRAEIPGWAGHGYHFATFFVCALGCHVRLARSRPSSDHLTAFYLWLALGGAVGGAFNAIIAPHVFRSVAEYPIALVAAAALQPPKQPGRMVIDVLQPALVFACLVGVLAFEHGATQSRALLAPLLGIAGVVAFASRARPVRFALTISAVLVAAAVIGLGDGRTRHLARSFYGVYRVVDDSADGVRRLFSGTTIHGLEFFGDPGREPLAYYHPAGPLGSLFAMRGDSTRWRVGAIGLGVGATVAYARPGEAWAFYEIDPLVAEIARNEQWFHFLGASPVSPRIVLGDARLSLAREPERSIDVLIVDAFSSDAIPVHLLTREALALYRTRLAANGVIAWHISNKYLDLRPVLDGLARDAKLDALICTDRGVPPIAGRLPSLWVMTTADREFAGALEGRGCWRRFAMQTPRLWRDDFSNVLSVLR
jgi:hypothetical protein